MTAPSPPPDGRTPAGPGDRAPGESAPPAPGDTGRTVPRALVPGWRRTLRSFRFAGAGCVYILRTQPNARVQATLAAAALALAAWLKLPPGHWALLLLTIGVVLALEAMNTAVEFAVDLSSPGPHPLAKVAKDASAAAVLTASLAAAAVGAILIGPPLWATLAS